MRRALAFTYGIVCYLVGTACVLYAVGFVGNVLVPKSIDSGASSEFWPALLVNLALLGLFGLQHSVMARPGFKAWWTKLVPKPVERSTYVLFASAALALLMGLWQPMPQVVWSVENEAGRIVLWVLYGLGWGLMLVSAELINSSHLFGLQQVREYRHGRELSDPEFQTPSLYRYVRHPLMMGFLIAFWAAPQMTIGRLVFALGMTSYIFIALQLEERDLVKTFGEKYQAYRKQVPMLIPRLRGRRVPKSSTNPRQQHSRHSKQEGVQP